MVPPLELQQGAWVLFNLPQGTPGTSRVEAVDSGLLSSCSEYSVFLSSTVHNSEFLLSRCGRLLSSCGDGGSSQVVAGNAGFPLSCNRGLGAPLECGWELRVPLELWWETQGSFQVLGGNSELLSNCGGNSGFLSSCSTGLRVLVQLQWGPQGSSRVGGNSGLLLSCGGASSRVVLGRLVPSMDVQVGPGLIATCRWLLTNFAVGLFSSCRLGQLLVVVGSILSSFGVQTPL